MHRWFDSGEGWEIANDTHDFRIGGHQHGQFRPVGHPAIFSNDTWYLEIFKDQRIVVAYTTAMVGRPLSHSPAVTEFFVDGIGGCRLVYTEQGADYGGAEDVTNRGASCAELFGKLENELRTHTDDAEALSLSPVVVLLEGHETALWERGPVGAGDGRSDGSGEAR